MDNQAYIAATNAHERRAQILSEIEQLEFEVKGLKLATRIKVILPTDFEQIDSEVPPRIIKFGPVEQPELTTRQLLVMTKNETAHWGVIYIENLITVRQKQIIELKQSFIEVNHAVQ
jgi:hypothetical protein